VRVLFVSHYALPHVGGIEVAIDAMARELARRGHDVVHVASDAVREGERGEDARPYRVVRVPAANVLEERSGAPWPLFGPRLLSKLRSELARADVLHAHGFLYLSSLAALLLARASRPGVARVLTEHVGHVPYESRLLDRSEALAIATLGRAAARSAQVLVHFNDKVADELVRLAPSARLARIPNGVDLERFRPAESDERAGLRRDLGWDERPRVLFVGRLVAKKGLDLALAAGAVAGRAFELVLAGPGRIAEGVGPDVRVLGAVPPDDMAGLYRAADALVLPSRGEGFPLSVQEAMASGLPAVLVDDPAYRPHLAGAGEGARLVAPEPPAIAAALSELLSDPDALARAGRDATAHARARFSHAAAADAHERLYAGLLQDDRAGDVD
jgi:D-inositol-3-phosphate glycosyltransferase